MIFAPEKRGPASSHQAVPAGVSGISESAYSSRTAIVRVLEEVREKRYEITIKLDRGDRLHIYHTRIHAVDADANHVVLHRLVPSSWTEAVGMMAEVEVQAQLPSGLIRFPALLTPLALASRDPYCVLSMPNLIHRQQLRSSFRVNVPARFSRITLQHDSDLISGHCLNLSLEGSCCMFRSDYDGLLATGAELNEINFLLDGSTGFRAGAVVRRVQILHGGSTQVGLRFHSLDKEAQRTLQASLINFQRHSLRKPFER